MTELVHALLCDDVRVEDKTHKYILIGLFDRFRVRELPSTVRSFVLFCRVALDNQQEHAFAVDLVAPSGATTPLVAATLPSGLPINPTYQKPTFESKIQFPALSVSERGHHRIVIKVDDRLLGEIPFLVAMLDDELETGGALVETVEPPKTP